MISRLWLITERYLLYQAIRLFRIKGQSERVARGFALGLVVNFFPTFGFGVVISGVVAKCLGGNGVAGLIGGSLLTFFWPLLFYLNIKIARALFPPNAPDRTLRDSLGAFGPLAWGGSLLTGAILNSLLFGGGIYVILRGLHWRIRPVALRYFRSHAREHQHRFGRHQREQKRSIA